MQFNLYRFLKKYENKGEQKKKLLLDLCVQVFLRNLALGPIPGVFEALLLPPIVHALHEIAQGIREEASEILLDEGTDHSDDELPLALQDDVANAELFKNKRKVFKVSEKSNLVNRENGHVPRLGAIS